MSKIVIGIVGKNGSGKDSVADYLVTKYTARKLVFSDMLKEALSIFLLENDISRMDMAWLSTALRERYGEGILAKGMKKRIMSSEEEVLVISGLRDFGELEMIRSFDDNLFICVDALPEIRWERMKKRKDKADDMISYEDFLKREDLQSEKNIGLLAREADNLIMNNDSMEVLKKRIDEAMKGHIKFLTK